MRTRNANLGLVACSAVLSCATFSVATAGPQGGVITAGEGTISTPNANSTVVNQSSNVLNLNWQSFNVGQPETVTFQQPGTSSVAINRILDQNASQIFGRIDANGRVVLLNPNGIVFGRTAQLNVGSLVASSLDLLSYDADGNRFSFSSPGNAGAVVNQGNIHANSGSVALLGARVTNDGFIVADYGTVALGAGKAATLDFYGDGLLQLQIDSAGEGAQAANSGAIAGSTVLLTAQAAEGVLANVVNNTGVVRAQRIDNSGGVIRLLGPGGTVTNSGTLDASSTAGSGGSVSVLGERAGLLGNALVDASGATSGGHVLVGGDFQGRNPDVLNSQRTVVGVDSVIRADGGSGDGGRVIVWADDTTVFRGDISAGSANANGGFVEVSGKDNLGFLGHVNTLAPNGLRGTLLLDPDTINVNGMNTNDAALDDGEILAIDGAGTFEITAAKVVTELDGNDVHLQATTAVNIVDPVNAGGNTNPGNLHLDAPTISIGAIVTLKPGSNLDLTSDIAVTDTTGTGMGTLSADAITFKGIGTVGSGGTPLSVITQSVVFDKSAGDTFLSNDSSGFSLRGSTAGALDVTAAGNITQGSGLLSVGGTAVFDVGAAAIVLDNTDNDFAGAVSFTNNGANDVSVWDTNDIVLGAQNIAAGMFTVHADDTITQSAAISHTGTSSFTGLTGIALDTPTNNFGGAVSLVSNGNAAIEDQNAIILGSINVTGTLQVDAVGITQTGTITNNGGATFNGGAGAITLTNANNLLGTVSLNNTGANDVSVTNNSSLDLGLSSVGRDLTINAVGITQSSALTVPGLATFNAMAGAISLANPGNNFIGNVSVNNSGANDVSITDSGLMQLAGSSVGSGTLTVTGNGIDSVAAITQAASAGAATFNAGAATLSLNGLNDFTGAVSLNNSGGGAVAINDVSALQFGTSNVGAGPFTATAVGISQSGAITQAGGGVVTFNGGAGAISLTQNNDFLGQVSLNNSGNNDVAITDVNSVALGNATLGSGTLTVNAVGINGAGAIVQAVGAGAATFNAGAAAITLNAANNFTGAVSLNNSGANNVSVNDVDALQLGASNVGGGTFTATAVGISQSGALVQAGGGGAGTATFNAGAGAITLNAANNFTGAVVLNNSGANNVAITDTNTLNFGAVNIGSGTFTANAVGIAQIAAFTQAGGAGATVFNGGAGSIVLTNGTNEFTGDVSLNNSGASNAFITDLNALTFGASNLGANLTVTTTGAVSQSGAIVVAGTTSIDTGVVGDTITLNDAGNDFNTVSIASGVNAVLTDLNGIDLGATLVAGTFTVNASGAVTDSGNITVGSGLTTVGAGAGNITLDSAGNDFLELRINSGTNATVVDANALRFDSVNLGGTLDATAAGSITQVAATGISVMGTSTFVANGMSSDVSLSNAGNAFTGAVNATAGDDVNLLSANGLTLGNITAGNHLIAETPMGNIVATGALNITTDTEFRANQAGASVTANNVGNNFVGSVAFLSTGGLADVAVTDTTTLDLGAMTLTGNLTANALGLTQSDVLSIGGATTVSGGAGDVTLGLDNNFGGAVNVTSATNVTLVDTNALQLGTVTAANTLAATATAGNITSSGAITVGAGSTFTANAAGASIILDNAGNDFAGPIAFAGAGGLANVTVFDTSTLTLPGLTLSGNLSAAAPGIDASGALVVAGATTINGAGADVTLTNAGNDFGTSLAVSGDDVAITDLNALALGASSAASLTVNAMGNVTQTGAVTVTNAATFDAGNANSLTLTNLANDFGSLGVSSALNVDVRDGSALTITSVSAAGFADIRSQGALTVGPVTAAGTVNLDSGGNIADDLDPMGVTRIAGTSVTLSSLGSVGDSSPSGEIDIDAAQINVNAGSNVFLRNDGSFTLSGFAGSGTIALFADGGRITLNGSLAGVTNSVVTVGNLGVTDDVDYSAETIGAGATNTITVLSGRDLTVGTVNGAGVTLRAGATTAQSTSGNLAIGTVNAAGGAITASALGSITSTGVLTGTSLSATGASLDVDTAITTLTATTTGNTIVSEADGLTLGNVSSGGLLNIATGGALVQAGGSSVTATGNATFTGANGGAITVNNAGNSFGGTVNFLASAGTLGQVSVRDITALDLGALTLTGSLTATGAGITDSGNLVVGGLATLNGGAGDLVLDSAGNDFAAVAAVTTGSATITDANALDLGSVLVDNNLTLNAAGNITDSGLLLVGGAATFAAGAANDVVLDNAASDFGSLSVTSANNVTLVDANVLTLGAVTAAGTLNATSAAGAIAGQGPLVIGGNATFTTSQTGSSIVLNNAGNNFGGTVTFAGPGLQNVTVMDSSALDLQTLTLAGTLNVTAAGVTDSGALNVAGTTTINGSGGNVVLDDAANDFSTIAVNNANDVTLVDASDLTLGTVGGTGNVSITATGALADDGNQGTSLSGNAVALTATSIGATGANAEIDLTATTLNATASAGGIFVRESDGLTLSAAATGAVVVDSGGPLTVTVNSVTGSSAALSAIGALTLGTINVGTGQVDLTATGAITDGTTGASITAGTLNIFSGSTGSSTNRLDTSVATLNASSTNGGIFIRDADALTLTADATGGAVDITNAAGALTVASASGTGVTLASAAALTATGPIAGGTGAVSLTSAGGGAMNVGTVSGGAITLNSANALTATGAITGTGAVNLTSAAGNAVTLAAVSGAATTVNSGAALNVNGAITGTGAVSLTSGGGGAITVAAAVTGAGTTINSAGALNATGAIAAGTGAANLTSAGAMTLANVTGGSTTLNSGAALTFGNVNVGTGAANVTATGAITDTTGVAITAGNLTISGNGIGTSANPINTAVADLTATAMTGGIFIADANDLRVSNATAAAGAVQVYAGSTTTAGSLQIGTISATENVLLVASRDILSTGGGSGGQISTPLAELRAGVLAVSSGQAGGQIGSASAPLTFGNNLTALTVFLPARSTQQPDVPAILPVLNGPAALEPQFFTFAGSGNPALFTPGFGNVPTNGLLGSTRPFTNVEGLNFGNRAQGGSDQILIIDWASFDPNISLFGTLNPAIRLPADQLEDDEAAMNLYDEPTEYTLVRTADGWKIVRAFRRVSALTSNMHLN